MAERSDRVVHVWLRNWDIHLDSPNKRRGAHWANAARRAKQAKNHVLVALSEIRRARGDSGRVVHLAGKVELSFVSRMRRRQRPLDADNAVGALKHVIDALVHHGVIDGDSPEIIPLPPHVLEIDAESHGGEPGLDITIRSYP